MSAGWTLPLVTEISIDELAVWRRALGHDGEAFGQIFDLHRDAAFAYALRLVTQPADAEEIAAAAFFELWRKRQTVRVVNGSVRAWLLVTVANLAKNDRRTLRRRDAALQRISQEHATETARDEAEFERVDEGLLRKDLVVALKRLKPQDVALVTMTALDGYSIREMAALLGLTENNARVRLHRARKRLRAQLQQDSPTARSLTEEEVR